MSSTENQQSFTGFEAYADSHLKLAGNVNNLDFSFFDSSSGQDIIVPAATFESDLDLNLEGFDDFDIQLPTVTPAFTGYRGETTGPLSTITVSSESAYDGVSNASQSFYNFPLSPAYAGSDYSGYPLDMDFQSIRVGSDYGAVEGPTSARAYAQPDFGALPPSPPISSPVRFAPKAHSDYQPSSMHSLPHHSRHPSLRYSIGGSTSSMLSHARGASLQLHSEPAVPPVLSVQDATENEMGQSRKKHQCSQCSRAFARAYNLKTHMDTHNPDRPKPHVCPFRSCGRSFSRKHDLQRHRAAIHRDQGSVSSVTADESKPAVGVERAARSWCDGCGKGWVGKEKACDCQAN